VKIALLLAMMALISACSRIPVEVCDSGGPVYLALVEHHQEWSEHFANRPQDVGQLETSSRMTVEIDGHVYVVWTPRNAEDGQPILVIASHEEYPRTLWGRAGYLYLPSGVTIYPPEIRIYTVK
jgi:hypothetical protein